MALFSWGVDVPLYKVVRGKANLWRWKWLILRLSLGISKFARGGIGKLFENTVKSRFRVKSTFEGDAK